MSATVQVKLAVKHTSGSQSHEGTLVFPSVGQDNLDDPEGLECAFEAKGTVGADDLRRVRKDCLALR